MRGSLATRSRIAGGATSVLILRNRSRAVGSVDFRKPIEVSVTHLYNLLIDQFVSVITSSHRRIDFTIPRF